MKTTFPSGTDWDDALFAVELEDEILGFVRGLRTPRENPVSAKQIREHLNRFPMFNKTTDENISDAMISLQNDRRVRIVVKTLSAHRRHDGAYFYEACKPRNDRGLDPRHGPTIGWSDAAIEADFS